MLFLILQFRLCHVASLLRNIEHRNGMATVVAERFSDKISFIERLSDRLMAAKIHVGSKATHVVAAYASQAGRSEGEEDQSWMDLGNFQKRKTNGVSSEGDKTKRRYKAEMAG